MFFWLFFFRFNKSIYTGQNAATAIAVNQQRHDHSQQDDPSTGIPGPTWSGFLISLSLSLSLSLSSDCPQSFPPILNCLIISLSLSMYLSSATVYFPFSALIQSPDEVLLQYRRKFAFSTFRFLFSTRCKTSSTLPMIINRCFIFTRDTASWFVFVTSWNYSLSEKKTVEC